MTERRTVGERLAIVAATLAISALPLSCGEKGPCKSEDPREVVQDYLAVSDAQSNEEAWGCLSQGTRAILEARAEAFNRAHPGQTRKGYEMIRMGHVLSSTREYKKFEIKAQEEARCVVEIVMQDDTKKEITLRREEGHWVIELPLDAQSVETRSDIAGKQ